MELSELLETVLPHDCERNKICCFKPTFYRNLNMRWEETIILGQDGDEPSVHLERKGFDNTETCRFMCPICGYITQPEATPAEAVKAWNSMMAAAALDELAAQAQEDGDYE